jgi:hypothetical protein
VAGDILDCIAETHRIEPHQVDAEMERVRRAFVQVEAELEESARRVREQLDPSLAEIFRAHQGMLESLLSVSCTIMPEKKTTWPSLLASSILSEVWPKTISDPTNSEPSRSKQ